MKEQIEERACKNCIHYQMCVDTFRKAKQDGDILLIEEEAYFADANGCDFYADKRIYRKQSEGEWIKQVKVARAGVPLLHYYQCSLCGVYIAKQANYCPNCGAKMKGGES